MSSAWCRIPSWAGLAVCDDRASKRGKAYVYLLAAWHIGNDPGPREIARMVGIGAGLTAKLTAEIVAWAIENGARLPERYSTATGTSHARALFFKKRRDQIRRRTKMPPTLTGQTLTEALVALDTLTRIAKTLPQPTRLPLVLTLNRVRGLLGLP